MQLSLKPHEFSPPNVSKDDILLDIKVNNKLTGPSLSKGPHTSDRLISEVPLSFKKDGPDLLRLPGKWHYAWPYLNPANNATKLKTPRRFVRTVLLDGPAFSHQLPSQELHDQAVCSHPKFPEPPWQQHCSTLPPKWTAIKTLFLMNCLVPMHPLTLKCLQWPIAGVKATFPCHVGPEAEAKSTLKDTCTKPNYELVPLLSQNFVPLGGRSVPDRSSLFWFALHAFCSSFFLSSNPAAKLSKLQFLFCYLAASECARCSSLSIHFVSLFLCHLNQIK